MQRGDLDHLLAFLAVGQERSFTRAAAKLGVSQSALCHTIRDLEERLPLLLVDPAHPAGFPQPRRANARFTPSACGLRRLRPGSKLLANFARSPPEPFGSR